MVKQPPWAGDDDLWLSTKLRYLATVRHTAVDRNALQSRARSERFNDVIDLLGELTCWSEYERLGALLLRATELLKDRKNERGRLSRSCLRESDKVAPLYNERNRLSLNWGWMGVSDRLYRLLKKGRQREIVKGKRADLFRS
jgi:hypothetical protein